MKEKKQEIIYQLDTMRPMSNVFVGKLIMGLSFAYSMIFMPFFFKILLGFVSASILLPLVKEYWSKQIKSICLTNKYLELIRGANGETKRVDLKDIRKIELIERHSSRRRRKRSEVATVIFERKPKHDYHPETKCVITDVRGNRTEIEYRFFMEGDFEEFLQTLENTYAQTYDKYINVDRTGEQIGIAKGSGNKIKFHTEHHHQYKDKGIIRLDELIEKNSLTLDKDIELKEKLEESLLEAYKSIYYVRNAFDIAKMSEREVIYEYEGNDGAKFFVLKDDFYEELDEENIEMGKNLIDTATKNIKVAEARTDSYEKINQRLRKLRFQKQRRIKLQGIMERLNDLQEQNTKQSLASNADLEALSSDEEIEWHLLNELEDLSEQVNQTDDLQRAISLHEHISLFDENDRRK